MPTQILDEPTLISVVIPAFNAAAFMPAAVQNVRSQNQARLEIILVDDGSTDETAHVAADLPDVTYCYQENSGPAAARNAGLQQANGEYIAFLDADDLWPEGSLQARLHCLQKNPQVDIALGKVRCLREASPAENGLEDALSEELSDPFVAFNIGAALYRKEVFEKVGDYDPTLRFGEDTDWFMRAREQGVGLLVLPDTTLHYRLHAGGMTHQKAITDLNVVQVLKKSLDRRRESNQVAQSLPDLKETSG